MGIGNLADINITNSDKFFKFSDIKVSPDHEFYLKKTYQAEITAVGEKGVFVKIQDLAILLIFCPRNELLPGRKLGDQITVRYIATGKHYFLVSEKAARHSFEIATEKRDEILLGAKYQGRIKGVWSFGMAVLFGPNILGFVHSKEIAKQYQSKEIKSSNPRQQILHDFPLDFSVNVVVLKKDDPMSISLTLQPNTKKSRSKMKTLS